MISTKPRTQAVAEGRQRPGVDSSTDNIGTGSFATHLQEAMEVASAGVKDKHLDTLRRQVDQVIAPDSRSEPGLVEQKQQLWEAALELESLFMHQLVSGLQRTVPRGGGVLPTSKAEEIFQGMLDEEWANLMARSGSTGLAKLLYDQLVHSLSDKIVDSGG